jgi:hypothetical protein
MLFDDDRRQRNKSGEPASYLFGTSRHDGLVWYRPPANGLALPFFLLLALMTALAVGL